MKSGSEMVFTLENKLFLKVEKRLHQILQDIVHPIFALRPPVQEIWLKAFNRLVGNLPLPSS